MTDNSSTFKTSDLAIAAFLVMKGKRLIEASVEKGGKFNFSFESSWLQR